jgi:hypothetical protein
LSSLETHSLQTDLDLIFRRLGGPKVLLIDDYAVLLLANCFFFEPVTLLATAL